MAKKKEAIIEDLNPNQKEFCREYVYDWNGTRAYQKVYPQSSEPAARSSASDLLSKPNIQAYIDYIQKDLEKLAGISRLKVLHEHLKIVGTSIAHLHNTWVTRKEFEALTDDQKDCIAEIQTQTRTETIASDGDPVTVQVDYVKIKLYDKQKSLDAINKMLGYDVAKKIELSAPIRNFKITSASERPGNRSK